MSNIYTIDQFKSDLEKYGPDYVINEVCQNYERQIKKFVFCRLNRLCCKRGDRMWGRCIDPDDHKDDVTQETLLEFSQFTRKFEASMCKNEILNLENYLFGISKNNCFDHLTKGCCSDLPPILTDFLDDGNYELQAEINGHEILDNLIFKENKENIFKKAKDCLPEKLRLVFESRLDGLSHEEISIQLGITNIASRQDWFRAVRKFRRFHDKREINS